MDPDPHQLEKWDLDPDPDPHQNVLDPPHCFKGNGKTNKNQKVCYANQNQHLLLTFGGLPQKKKFRLRAVLACEELNFSN